MDESIFSNIDRNLDAKIKLQNKQDNKIVVSQRGRPRRPNMVKKLIKVDKVLYQQLAKKAEEEQATIASLLSRAIKRELNN